MEKGYTLTEVIILFVIFATVAILFIPLTVEDAITSRNAAKWQAVQSKFMSIYIDMKNTDNGVSLNEDDFVNALKTNFPVRNNVKYKIKYLNGNEPDDTYKFDEIYTTKNGAAIAYKWLNTDSKQGEDKLYGLIMYDVNGKHKPNVWGKDIFGMQVYGGKISPIGKNEDPITAAADCSKQGSGVYCSSYILKEDEK